MVVVQWLWLSSRKLKFEISNLKFHETITEYTPRYKISNLKFQI